MSTELETKQRELHEAVTALRSAFDKGISDTAANANKGISEIKGEIEQIKAALVESKTKDSVADAVSKADAEDRKAIKAWLMNGAPGVPFARSAEGMKVKATVGNESTGADGGYGVPTVIQSAVDLIIQETSPIESLADSVTIGTQSYIKLLDNNDATASWGAEVAASGTGLRTQTNVNTFTKVQLTPQILYANPQLSLEMIEDVQFDAVAELGKALGDRLARARATGFVSGTGASNQPYGFNSTTAYSTNDLGANAPSVSAINTITGGGTAAIVSDDVYQLIYNLRAGYRSDGSFACHRLVQEKIRTLKDSYGRYMWQPSMILGQPDTLAGYPIYEFDDMPSVLATTGSPTLALTFADWDNFYVVVNRVGLQMLRDPYSVEGAVVFKTRQRVTGGIKNGIAGVTLSVPV